MATSSRVEPNSENFIRQDRYLTILLQVEDLTDLISDCIDDD